MAAPSLVEVAGRQLKLTNLEKVYWPEDGYTKGDLITYYVAVAPYLLPHLKDRPLVLTRYPDGIGGEWFYQKDTPQGAPPWLRTFPFTGEERTIDYALADEPAALAYLANLGALEIHPWMSRIQQVDQCDHAVIDLDPAEGATWADVRQVALLVKQVLETFRVHHVVKLSGATGVHIYCPLAPGHSYADASNFAEAIGRLLLRVYSEKVTLERSVAKRGGKVYVDYLQNRRGKTITSVYGVRPRPGAPVSHPVHWQELALPEPPRFTIKTLGQRLTQVGDLFAPLLRMQQDIRPVTERLLQQ